MQPTRRTFFKLLAGAAAVVALPASTFIPDAPMVWGDGIHDDAPGLNALIRGDAVQFADPAMASKVGWRGNVFDFGGTTFRCEDSIVFNVDRNNPIVASNLHVLADHPGYALEVVTKPQAFVQNGAYQVTYGGA